MSRALMLFATLAIGIFAGWLLTFSRHKKEQNDENKG